jgi:hypothetical protein
MKSWRTALALPAMLCCAVASAADLAVRVLDGDDKPLEDAVIFVPAVAAPEKNQQPRRATIAQRERTFDPFVTVIEKGGLIDFPNEDTMLHHVYSFSPAKRFEIKLYKGTPPAPVVFETPGVVVLGCNLHDWMLAYVVVLDTRLYAKTGQDGRARIAGVPAGTHDLMAWYPGMRQPVRLQQIDVRGDVLQLDAKLSATRKARPRAPPIDPMRY